MPVVEVEQAVSAERASAADQPSRSSRRTSPVAADSGNDSGASQQRPSSGVLGIAASLTGISDVYGGTTPAGFDCSGYTQWVFGKAGRSLPRTAEAQRQAATPVSDPQPGDLVFFGAPAFHVGIYAGGGMMYDSPRTGKATAKRVDLVLQRHLRSLLTVTPPGSGRDRAPRPFPHRGEGLRRPGWGWDGPSRLG